MWAILFALLQAILAVLALVSKLNTKLENQIASGKELRPREAERLAQIILQANHLAESMYTMHSLCEDMGVKAAETDDPKAGEK